MTPYDAVGEFAFDEPPENIVVHTSEGPKTVVVEVVPELTTEKRTGAVGISPSRSIDDAFAAAVQMLPAANPPNVPRSFDVRIRYQDGGITGPLVIVYLE